MSIIYYQAAGLIFTIALQFLIINCAYTITRKFWVLAYLGILFLTCSFLSIHALFDISYFSITPLLILIGVGVFSLRKNFRNLQISRPSKLEAFVSIFLVVLIVYSAFPAYRYDQLSYHLLVNKQIYMHGELTPPIFQDHFMTGLYEYFFLMARYLWNNDFFVICHANSFSCTTLFILTFGAVQLFNKLHSSNLPSFIVATFALFAFPERMAIINTKPDYLMAPISFILVLLIPFFTTSLTLQLTAGFIIGFVSVFKITWLHFAVALCLVFSLWTIKERKLKFLVIVELGIISGLALGSVYLIKNQIFYGNMIHPAQFWLFKSEFFSPSYQDFWAQVASKPTDFVALLKTYIQMPESIVRHYFWFLIPITLSIFIGFRKQTTKLPIFFPVLVLITYILIWPLFYSENIFPRFIAPFAGLLLLIVCLTFKRNDRLLLLALLLPVFLSSSADVYIAKMVRFGISEEDLFASINHPSQRSQSKILLINQHMKDHPFCQNSITLSDYNDGYFLNGGLLKVDGFQNEIYWQRYKPTGGSLESYASSMHICYFFADRKAIKDWPNPFNHLLEISTHIGDGVYFLESGQKVITP